MFSALSQSSRKKWIATVVLLTVIFLFGLYIRNAFLPDNLLFGYEQGRDALITKQIISFQKLTLLGPKTDIDGIYHGVGYYYLLAGIYFFTQGDPGSTIFIFTCVNAITILVIFFLAKEIIQSTRYAILSSVMAAISFDIIIYGRWLSNVSFSIPLVGLFFYLLTKLIKTKNANYWLGIGLVSGLLAHFEILHALYSIFTIAIAIKLFSIKINNRQFLLGLLLLLLVDSTFILFDIRHQFLLVNGILHYLVSQSLSADPLFIMYRYINELINSMVRTLYPSNGLLVFITLLVLCYLYVRKQNIAKNQAFQIIILMVLFSFPYVFFLKYNLLEHFYAGTAIGWIIFFNFLMRNSERFLHKYVLVAIYLLIIFSNSSYILRNLQYRTNIFYLATQTGYIYKDQKAVLDYIFSHPGNGFVVDSFDIPYYHQESWEYLYNWYGPKQYAEIYKENIASVNKDTIYLIIEPGTSGIYLDKWLNSYRYTSTFVQDITIGGIHLQQRRVIKAIPKSNI